MAFFVAMAIHAVLILGISFDIEDLVDPRSLMTMEVTLVHNKTDESPVDANYLAQANQLGGGKQQDKTRPSSPFSNPQPTQEDGFASQSAADMSPPPMPNKKTQTEIMTVQQSPQILQSQKEELALPLQADSLTAAQLFERSREIARLSAEINKLKQAFQKTPHHTYITGANAKEFKYASYLDAWRAKVERIGNMNYPAAATKQNLTGSLLLDVAIKADGSLHSLRVLRSSGFPILDHAAKRIVRLSAPFAPLTQDILKDTDVLHIPRIWQFKSGGLQTSVN